jgi:MFS family permease|tara:strand:- start:56 stop:352 length:297 start_codon:yes stop_codon:yes gene_type:complete
MVIATIIENISVDSIFNKNLPKESRGALNGLFSFSGQSGILIYSIIGGWMFDNIGRFSPFVIIGICDFSFAMLCLIHGLKQESPEAEKNKAKNKIIKS